MRSDSDRYLPIRVESSGYVSAAIDTYDPAYDGDYVIEEAVLYDPPVEWASWVQLEFFAD